MISRTFSACVTHFSGQLVTLEASKQNSLPQIQITGLPNTVVQESRERVKACLAHLGFPIPTQKLLVHLSPAETKKSGSQFDLAIAMALLTLEGFFPNSGIQSVAFLGELTLSGQLKAVNHCVPLLEVLLSRPELDYVLLPKDNEEEAVLFKNSKIILCNTLQEALGFCFKDQTPPGQISSELPPLHNSSPRYHFFLEQLQGQALPKRALMIALAGGHPLLIEGPPGSGKTHLAHCSASLLPPLTWEEVIEVSRIYSFLGEPRGANTYRPFRSPHHSISGAAFLGGGNQQVIPGEISLAHRGILFLDEFPEFRRDALEGLREPLQSGEIHLHRISKSVCLPANFHLVAAMNPCRCGYANSTQRTCVCTADSVSHYRKKVSGPLIDRFQLYVWMESSPLSAHQGDTLNHLTVKTLIEKSRETLRDSACESFNLNTWSQRLNPKVKNWLALREVECRLSFRRLRNIFLVARTIGSFEGRESPNLEDFEEAWALRAPENFL